MKRFEIVIRPDFSALSIGGRTASSFGADRATARDQKNACMIPATALRGALRIELERLLRGLDPEARICGANRDETQDPGKACECPICRLFGDSGVAMGALRLEDAVLTAHASRSREVAARSRVALDRETRTAANQQLVFLETSPLLDGLSESEPGWEFRAAGVLLPLHPRFEKEDWSHLRAACRALRAIGGGRAVGLGWVDCTLEERQTPRSQSMAREFEGGKQAGIRLHFEALAPLHFGVGPAIGYFQPSRREAPGSTVRGAIAYALLEREICTPEDAAFQMLFGPESKVSFGSARADGQVPSATRRQCRLHEHIFDDLLGEISRRCAAEQGLALAFAQNQVCLVEGCEAEKVSPIAHRRGALHPKVTVRTRTALNRRTGTSMDAKLFSHEALEPWAVDEFDPEGRVPLVLSAELWGIDPKARALLAKLHGHDVWLGGKRSQGLGRCRLTLEEIEPGRALASQLTVIAVRAALVESWNRLRQTVGDRLPSAILQEDEAVLVIILEEPWCPPDPASAHRGPLAMDEDLEVLASFLELREEGRFGAFAARRYQAPAWILQGEASPQQVVAAGSIYVYRLPQSTLNARLPDWIERGRRGCGAQSGFGWGRFRIRGLDPNF